MVERVERQPGALNGDAALLSLLRRGDEAAFAGLFARHYGTVFRAAYGMTRSREEAEDAAQEAFLALYRTPPPVTEAGSSLAAWLCRVALNRAANALRGERRARAREERLGRLAEETNAPSAEERVEREEERARVRAALAGLPEHQARILALRGAGLSYAEIAQAIEIAPGSVGTLLARAERAFVQAYDREK